MVTEKFACDMCDKEFTYKQTLNEHKREKHYGATVVETAVVTVATVAAF